MAPPDLAHNSAVDLVVRRREIPPTRFPTGRRPSAAQHGALVAALASLPDRQRHATRSAKRTVSASTRPPPSASATPRRSNRRCSRPAIASPNTSSSATGRAASPVRRLASGPLDGDERRALKTHLRSCAECRRAVPAPARLAGLLPAGAADWLRALPGLLAGGGAPAAVRWAPSSRRRRSRPDAPLTYDLTRDQNPRRATAAPPCSTASRNPGPPCTRPSRHSRRLRRARLRDPAHDRARTRRVSRGQTGRRAPAQPFRLGRPALRDGSTATVHDRRTTTTSTRRRSRLEARPGAGSGSGSGSSSGPGSGFGGGAGEAAARPAAARTVARDRGTTARTTSLGR